MGDLGKAKRQFRHAGAALSGNPRGARVTTGRDPLGALEHACVAFAKPNRLLEVWRFMRYPKRDR